MDSFPSLRYKKNIGRHWEEHGNMITLLGLVPLEETPLIPAIEVDPNSVTPGVVGFVVTFVVGVLVLLLVIDLARRVRRVRYREEIAEKLDAEANPEQAGQ